LNITLGGSLDDGAKLGFSLDVLSAFTEFPRLSCSSRELTSQDQVTDGPVLVPGPLWAAAARLADTTAGRQEQLPRLAATGEPVRELAAAFGIGRSTAYR
jgi:hypothetical protein